jgi:hypothetical protein
VTWVRKDDGAPLNKKFFRAGLTAYGWHDAALCYCNRYLTDGFIPARDVDLVFPGTPPGVSRGAIEALVREGSLHVVTAGQRLVCPSRSPVCPRKIRDEDGWSVHDFFAQQPTKKQVVFMRREKSKRGRKGAEIRWKNRSAAPSPEHSGEHPTANAPLPSHSRPTPVVPERKTEVLLVDSGEPDRHTLRRLVDAHARQFAEKTGVAMVVSYPRDCKRVKPIIDAHGIEKALELDRQFFMSNTGWWVQRNAWNIGVFVSAINDLAGENGQVRTNDKWADRPGGRTTL